MPFSFAICRIAEVAGDFESECGASANHLSEHNQHQHEEVYAKSNRALPARGPLRYQGRQPQRRRLRPLRPSSPRRNTSPVSPLLASLAIRRQVRPCPEHSDIRVCAAHLRWVRRKRSVALFRQRRSPSALLVAAQTEMRVYGRIRPPLLELHSRFASTSRV